MEIKTVSSPLETDNAREIPDMRKANLDKIKEELNIDWESVLAQNSTTTEDIWNAFFCKYLQVTKSCIPTRKISSHRKNKTVIPFSKNTVNLIRKKHRLWSRDHERARDKRCQQTKGLQKSTEHVERLNKNRKVQL